MSDDSLERSLSAYANKQRALLAALGIEDVEPGPEEPADCKVDWDGGAREPVPNTVDAEGDHNEIVLELLQAARSARGNGPVVW